MFEVSLIVGCTDLIVVHYYLGILIFIDTAEATGRTRLLERLAVSKAEAIQVVLNTLEFGLENTFTPIDMNRTDGLAGVSSGFPSTSFVAWDPYPHHTVAAVKLAFNFISANFAEGEVSLHASGQLSTLSAVLRHLPGSSKFVQATREIVDETLLTLRGTQ